MKSKLRNNTDDELMIDNDNSVWVSLENGVWSVVKKNYRGQNIAPKFNPCACDRL